MYNIRLEGLKDPLQARRKIFLFQIIFLAKRSDIVHQVSDLLEFNHDHIPLFLVLLYFLLT
jgi:hypothetical protein